VNSSSLIDSMYFSGALCRPSASSFSMDSCGFGNKYENTRKGFKFIQLDALDVLEWRPVPPFRQQLLDRLL